MRSFVEYKYNATDSISGRHLVVAAELEQAVDEDLVGDVDDLEVAGTLHAEQMVELVAQHDVLALHGGTSFS